MQEFFNVMYSYSLFPITTLPTRITPTSAILINKIWSSQPENSVSNYIIKADITDHYPVILVFKCDNYVTHSQLTYITRRVLTQDSLSEFGDILLRATWSEILNCTYPNDAYNLFYFKFKSNYVNSFPEKISS